MIKLFKRIFKNENGQIVVLFPFLFIIICGFIGLAVDTSWIVYNKHKLQNSTDLATLSGAQCLPSNTSEASTEALKYLQQNYEKSIGANIIFSNNDCRMDVDSEDNINLFFSPLFGVQTATIKATAGVQVGPIAQAGSMVPIGIDEKALDGITIPDEGTIFTLFASVENGGFKDSGNFGLLDPSGGGGGTSDLINYIINGYEGDIPSVGEFIDTETGYNPNNVCDAFVARFIRDPIIICPIVDWSTVQGGSEPVKVIGYAAFEITSEPTRKGNDIEITGKFIKYIDPDGIPGNVPDYGTKCISLIK